ncbi:hypothetical protein CALVIDRAFT_411354 [Calocera viscosa TUFC12733]|uniref:Uncharacterized protein n=1 Tax=Calocera viscosa (strain TUFC12733) TaxID=1330018 RepID=A0A167G605_CALVF|nr:hypothetical protein CALVIDRAFT_411354 [Calocera viscosa TUFC12733]
MITSRKQKIEDSPERLFRTLASLKPGYGTRRELRSEKSMPTVGRIGVHDCLEALQGVLHDRFSAGEHLLLKRLHRAVQPVLVGSLEHIEVRASASSIPSATAIFTPSPANGGIKCAASPMSVSPFMCSQRNSSGGSMYRGRTATRSKYKSTRSSSAVASVHKECPIPTQTAARESQLIPQFRCHVSAQRIEKYPRTRSPEFRWTNMPLLSLNAIRLPCPTKARMRGILLYTPERRTSIIVTPE